MKATTAGRLNVIPDCYIIIPLRGAPNNGKIELRALPDISDSKQANYNHQDIIGRSAPLYTYSHSADRQIGMALHFHIIQPGDAFRNLQTLRLIQAAVYPREGSNGAPYRPPVICRIRCGDLLSTREEPEVCVILTQYSVKFPTEVAWENVRGTSSSGGATGQYCPYKFDIDTSWTVVYTNPELPFANKILQTGYK